jgi:hypothetical protein
MKNTATTIISMILFAGLSIAYSLFCFSALAQDTIVTSVDSVSSVDSGTSNIAYYLMCGFIAAYEVVIRLIPTVGNYSVLSIAYKILVTILPNFKKGGGKHE